MPPLLSRADGLREFLTGAGSDGGSQSNPAASLGGYYSSTEAASLGITILNPISGVTINFASGANGAGTGTLTATDANDLTWTPAGASGPGAPAFFSGTGVGGIVEALNTPAAYLRVTATTPFSGGPSSIITSYLNGNFWGFDDVSSALASSGETEYRAAMLRNMGASTISGLIRWLNTLGTVQTSNVAYLSGSGGGTISTGGSYTTWPLNGWCQVRSSGGTLKEVVYYSARTLTALTIPAAGRGLLGTSATAGSSTDLVYPTPGVAIGVDSAGAQAFGTSIQTIANANTAPTGITWNLEITQAAALNIGNLNPNQQIGLWMKRQVPAGAVSTPSNLTSLIGNFNAF
jgi:hypothetical protein